MLLKKDGVDLSLQITVDGPLAEQYPARTRDEARGRGHTRYFDGVPCWHGHIAPRKAYSRACCECVRLRFGAIYQRNKKTITRKIRENRAKNPEFHRQKQREYIEKNIERVRIARKIGNNRRRERMEQVEGTHTAEDLRKILNMQNGKCGYCKKRVRNGDWHADHIKPIARGGSNWPSNIQVLCPNCNARKHARDPIDFAQSIGLLI
ncbi:MAG: HNH endonuclease [Mesorhizobium sp.]|nr:MAG: HNH endonuclease [Mesorhizobium sp.]